MKTKTQKRELKLFLSSLSIVLMTAGCQNSKSSDMMTPPVQEREMTENGGSPEFEFEPKAEILFVVDNSASMKNHITKVSANIDSFVRAFAKNNPLRYHLAVMSVYDTRTYSSASYTSTFRSTDRYFDMGQFRQVRNAQSRTVDGKYFISSEDDHIQDLLRNTLKVGVQDINEGGPIIEESFSPIAALYNLSGFRSAPKSQDTHKGFFMGKDSYKVIFFVTDANDASSISASDLYWSLVARSGGQTDKVMAFGAIVPSDSRRCKADPGDRAYKLEEFLRYTKQDGEGSNIVSLCDSFGAKFAQFGKSIRTRALSQVIRLKNSVPVISNSPDETLRVFYGRQEIPMELQPGVVGFRYDPVTNSIHINPDFQFEPQPGAKIRLNYKAVNPVLLRHGRVRRFQKGA